MSNTRKTRPSPGQPVTIPDDWAVQVAGVVVALLTRAGDRITNQEVANLAATIRDRPELMAATVPLLDRADLMGAAAVLLALRSATLRAQIDGMRSLGVRDV